MATAAPVTDSTRAAPPAAGALATYLAGDEDARARGLFRIVGEDGTAADADVVGFDRDLVRRLYEGMLRIRVTDARMMALQRQGRIGFYGEAMGQEAAVVGAAAASAPDDWIVPALREAGVGLYRGMTLDDYISQIYGNAADTTKGRQMPCHPCDVARHYVVMSSCVSSQIPHAVGIAMAMKIRGDAGRVAFGFMGDGGTSEPDFHVALNFAGVMKVPCVLICQNNQWAISTPGSLQTAAETIALKGVGYGVASLRADGNDVLAVYAIVRHAAERARRGEGPTFIELLTYRVSAHTSSDDPSRYRDESVTAVWKTDKDPLRRARLWLEHRGWLAAGEHDAIAARIEAEVRDVIARQEKIGPPPVSSIIEDVFAEPTWLLREQLAALDE
jgi:pyruvate dehydrogenase E1 component alpha subunit/2-oxoisovalerate dehydrogenase E1 component alpha subunit